MDIRCCVSAPAPPLLRGLLSMYNRTMAWLRLLLSFMRVARVCSGTSKAGGC